MFADHRVTVTVLRTAPARFGGLPTTTTHEVAGCLIAPRSSGEPGEFADTVVSGATLYLPAGADIVATDRVRVRDVTYDVEGDVGDWGPAGSQVALRRSSG